MGGTTEADKLVINYSEAAESREQEIKAIEKNAETAQQLREIAISEIFEMRGKIKATNFFKTQADFFNLLVLKQVKDSKDYRNQFGMTWEAFCESVGLKRRT